MGQVAVLDAHDPVAHRAEQRLDDDIAAELVECLHRVVVALADGRGRGCHPGEGQHRARPRLVDRALDRARAVDATDTLLGEDVQRVHPEDHLLERAAREPTDDQQVERVERSAVGTEHVHASAGVDDRTKPHSGDREHLVTASGERSDQPARVPRAGRAEDGDAERTAHDVNERSSTSGASSPP